MSTADLMRTAELTHILPAPPQALPWQPSPLTQPPRATPPQLLPMPYARLAQGEEVVRFSSRLLPETHHPPACGRVGLSGPGRVQGTQGPDDGVRLSQRAGAVQLVPVQYLRNRTASEPGGVQPLEVGDPLSLRPGRGQRPLAPAGGLPDVQVELSGFDSDDDDLDEEVGDDLEETGGEGAVKPATDDDDLDEFDEIDEDDFDDDFDDDFEEELNDDYEIEIDDEISAEFGLGKEGDEDDDDLDDDSLDLLDEDD